MSDSELENVEHGRKIVGGISNTDTIPSSRATSRRRRRRLLLMSFVAVYPRTKFLTGPVS